MKTVYMDATIKNAPILIFSVKETQVLNAGATIYSMPVNEKNDEYRRYACEYDVRFIFDDDIPVVDFYTVPQVDIFAVDSSGGYLGTVGDMTDLRSDLPICYINNEHECFLVANTGKEFLDHVQNWKERLVSFEEVKFFVSREAAKQEYEFFDIEAAIDDLSRRKHGC